MISFRSKVEEKVKRKSINKQELQDTWSATEFKKGLSKGKLSVGSLLFSGDTREVKIIKQVCTYLGYKYLRKVDLKCKHFEANNTFYVIHYIVE